MKIDRNGITLGDKARDSLTGFSGTVTGIADYFTGCSQASLQPLIPEGGDYKGPSWFDVDRLEVTRATAVVHEVKTARGGPSGGAPTK